MAYWISDPAQVSYEITQGGAPSTPTLAPPRHGCHTDYSRDWQYEMDRSIGAHPWVQLVTYPFVNGHWDRSVEIDLTHCIADGGLHGFEFAVPDRDLGAQNYQVTDWRIAIRPTHVAELEALLSYDGTPWRGRLVHAYLCLARAGDRLPLYAWRVDDIRRGETPALVLLDQRREMLRGPLYADGMDIPDATTWTTTLDQTDSGGETPPTFHSEYVDVLTNCQIGRVEITMTGATTFSITAPGHSGSGSTTADYYADADHPTQGQFVIRREAWGAGAWEGGDTITWTWTFSFRRQRSAAGYIRVPAAMYYLARMGGYAADEFDASPLFPGVPDGASRSWWLTGYPCIGTDGDWGADLVGPVGSSNTWDYAEWMVLSSQYIRIAFSQPCTVLEAISEVGKGIAYITPGNDGRLRLIMPHDPGHVPVVCDRTRGMMRCEIRREKPGSWMRGIHEYLHMTGRWNRVLYFPESQSEAYHGYTPPTGTQEAQFLGYPRILESCLEYILTAWHLVHKDGAPVLVLRMGLPGFHYCAGHRLSVTSEVESDIYQHRAVVDVVQYDFGTWTVTVEAIDWSQLQLAPLILQPDVLEDEEHCWDGQKRLM